MSKLWVKFQGNQSLKVSTADCTDVDDFMKACRKELVFLYGKFPDGQMVFSTSGDGPALAPDLLLSDITLQEGYPSNSAQNPLYIRIRPTTQPPPSPELASSYH